MTCVGAVLNKTGWHTYEWEILPEESCHERRFGTPGTDNRNFHAEVFGHNSG